jgi:hypothetical protein
MSDYLINMSNDINGDSKCKLLEKLYNNYLLKKDKIDKIPKIIH